MKEPYLDLYQFWFENPHVWFTASTEDDVYITDRWYPLLEKILQDPSITCFYIREKICHILLLDQVSRHTRKCGIDICIKECTKLACDISREILTQCQPNSELSLEELFFVLLPLRHTKQVENIQYVLAILGKIPSIPESSQGLFRRFTKATWKDLLFANNRIQCKTESYFTGSSSEILPVIEHGALNFCQLLDHVAISREWKEEIDRLCLCKDTPVTVSLSGGVDSMVLLMIMRKLGYRLQAVHIDYRNRVSSEIEAKFVTFVCNQIKVPCFVRTFYELQRGRVSREIYEDVTKQARFDMYRCVGPYPVLFGHHKDDCLENILTNVCASKKWDNLTGMEVKSRCMDVEILRPLLGIHKADLFDFAKRYSIPYLIDTTRKDCTRGRIRTKLIPSLQEYDSNLIHGLYMMAVTMQDMFCLVRSACQSILQQKVTYSENHFALSVPKHLPLAAWRFLCLELHLKDVSHKSLENLVWKLQRNTICLHKTHWKHPLNREWMTIWESTEKMDGTIGIEFLYIRGCL